MADTEATPPPIRAAGEISPPLDADARVSLRPDTARGPRQPGRSTAPEVFHSFVPTPLPADRLSSTVVTAEAVRAQVRTAPTPVTEPTEQYTPDAVPPEAADTTRGPRQPGRSTAPEVFKTFISTPEPPPEPVPWREADLLTRRPAFLTPMLHLALVLGLVTALFTAAQGAVLYNQITLLPGWLRPLGYALLLLVVLVLLYYGGRLVWAYARLRVSPRLSLQLDEDLQERETARQQLSTEHLAAARQTLTHFLLSYPLRPGALRALTQRGMEPMALEALRATQQVLTGPNAPADDREWLRRFEQEFLGPLDDAARQQTWRHMKAVGLFTATSAWGALDALGVLVVSYKLVADLCTIYHVRAGGWETAMLLARMLVNLVTASQIEAAAGAVESSVHDWLHSSLAHLAGRVVGKVAEGSVNALLIRRLSIRTQAYLRPIRALPAPRQPV